MWTEFQLFAGVDMPVEKKGAASAAFAFRAPHAALPLASISIPGVSISAQASSSLSESTEICDRSIGRAPRGSGRALVCVRRRIAVSWTLSVFCFVVVGLMSRTAYAQCLGGGGTTTCSGNPATFPSGGATTVGSDTTLDVNSLTGNIAPIGGVAGASVVFAPGAASNGSVSFAGIPNSNASNGASQPDVNVNFVGSGGAFQVNSSGLGIVAQSSGQAGGNGGTGYGATIPLPPFVLPGLGGNGGSGGNGGAATIVTTGSGVIMTSGDNNHGIMALSTGGAGGNGGAAITILGVIGEGGNGGNGGNPGAASVTNVLGILTSGNGAAGIWAQSVGGSGGAGGSAGGSIINEGGTGAAASSGQAVQVTNSGAISTLGTNAVGIFAQSVGGFAGSGGGAFGLFSFGGSPSSAGNGGVVNVTTSAGATISTAAAGATGIFAQSVGGGGGSGGAGGGLVGFGGTGSTGGSGGKVTVISDEAIKVGGDLASGIFAQSVGGGGGTAGVGAGLVGVGGNGGGGGNADAVSVTNTARIDIGGSGSLSPTSGQSIDAAGIYAQSVGGGGGNGALGVGLVGVGGTGGAAGNGAAVTVTNSGDIIHGPCANCTEAPTIFAQSVGGGGGDGGSAGGLVAVGGNGGGGGGGSTVTVANSGNLAAVGQYAPGIFAQSVGGGGGNGGTSVAVGLFVSVAVGGQGGSGGNGGNVCVNGDPTCSTLGSSIAARSITTNGFRSPGIFAQSVGGGGGNGGGAISLSGGVYGSASFAIGGPGGGGGLGQNVFAGANGSIGTSGDYSPGIDASSIGGGGGNGGYAISATGGATYGSLALSFGGSGGSGSKGGAVIVDSAADISTDGAFSSAVSARSIGGGGGNGGFTVGAAGTTGAGIALTFGGAGGAGADAGTVNVTSVGNLTTGQMGNYTQSANSDGVFAQSVGGSGGSGGFAISGSGGALGNVSLGLGGDGGNGGNGQAVTVNNNTLATIGNRIATYGANSDGIFAQSIGGSGGDGGFSVAAGGGVYASINLAFGGHGAGGGDGNAVQVTSYGAITTYGDKSSGIVGQSVGGGGGNGGFAAAAGGAEYGALSLGLGGNGAQGGNGGAVTIGNDGAIATHGMQSDGIFAQSLGGGGGNGGLAVTAAGAQYASLALSFGGSGGNAGVGAAVKVDSTGAITTTGDQSTGIFAQSIGGSGGNGGAAISGTLTLETGFSGNLSMAVGGKAGDGATGGTVHVGNTGDISTSGLNAAGILAQSIGGSGGNGGFSGALNLAGGGATFTSSVGGNAGAGDKASAVDVESAGNISTAKANSVGIFAQSVGGGGGNGGFSLLLAASYDGTSGPTPKTVGGAGGSTGTGGAVSVTSNGTITTLGNLSDGILAQSVGGGGGRGGFSIGANLSYSGSTDINSVGGNAGSGADANQVHVSAIAGFSDPNHPGFSVYTTGDNSVGIFAQSIGGGGGNGGFSIAGSLNAGGAANGSTVGGTGGAAGNSLNVGAYGNAGYKPAVEVDNTGYIYTGGRNSSAIEAQSIGGGGGDGGFSVGVSGTISDSASKLQSVGGGAGAAGAAGDVIVNNNNSVNSTSAIITAGDLSYGVLAQSIGGGGGNGGFAISGSLSTGGGAEANATGGAGAGGGNAGLVMVTSGGAIVTGATINGSGQVVASGGGQGSVAILAQSIGGGGGNGGFAGGLALGIGGDATTNSTGGSGGHAGDAGNVTVTTLAGSTVLTYGDNAAGILAQSVGGGGGNGGFAIGAGFTNSDGKSATNSTGGQSGAGGKAGDVSVTNAASVTTFGYLSNGVVAQSIGGGGGNGGFAVSGALALGGDASANATGGSGGAGGDAGAVTVANTGAIEVNKLGTIGLLAQSIGGGGGNGGFAGGVSFSNSGDVKNTVGAGAGGAAGDGSSVNVTNSAAITANGAQGVGILAQSVGGGGGNGGFALSGAISSSAASESNSVGGAGGGAGKGADVTVTNKVGGAITTSGAMAYGVLAQSIGGSGGNGGFSIGGAISLGGNATSTVGAGAGGGGGSAGVVNVDNYDKIATNGAQSTAIFAQSVGGGGGAGGFAGGLSFSSSGDVNNNVGGGSGGAGSTPSDVTVNNHAGASIVTNADNSIGILAQAVGGGGGQGGFSIAGGISAGGNAMSQSVGGNGGAGGSAFGTLVAVANDGSINTAGSNSIGIVAQSIGGGGGNGAFAIDGAFSNSGSVKNQVGAGAGGAAGDAGDVQVTNSGAIFAQGAKSTGILAQSVGGGGGNGGFAISGGFSTSAASETDNVGGAGGGAGKGGDVTVTNNVGGTITTNGAMSYGVIAQSIGGSGGNGGFAIGGSIALGGDATAKVGGGAGGGGGSAGVVTVDNYDKIATNGGQSTGIVAQSIGGGGGNGGFAGGLSFSSSGSINNSIGGGSGGAGSTPSDVTVNNHSGASIVTNADNSIGILAQAVGGGGGQGGFSISGGVSNGGGMSQSVGGNGGAGGSAAGTTVTVSNDGRITTNGANSMGIFAQSVGGGGGVGGVSVAGVMDSSGGAQASVGGSAGGGGGAAGDVKVTNSGVITVNGAGSVGVYAQSVGGGGGAAGFAGAFNFSGGGALSNKVGGGGNGGAGGNVTVISTGSIITNGQDSVGVMAQSIGGGGGSSIFSIAQQINSLTQDYMSIGGGGAGTQGANGVVTIQVSGGTTSTVGDLSYGLLAQAIGAGGGAAALSVPDPLTIGAGGNVTVLGASGSISGNGNPINSTNSNATYTTGVGAIGLLAQTIGGGGGSGGVTGDVVFTAPGPITITAGGSTTGGGMGGVLQFANTATTIQTGGGAAIASGDAAVGLLAQTIGGGGGAAIDAFGNVTGSAGLVSLTLGGSEGAAVNPDNGGALTLSSGGQITTYGRFAPGFVGQTIGGGGGFAAVTAATGLSATGVQFALGATGGVGGAADPSQSSTWTLNAGSIATSGKLSDAAVAQAIGGGGGLAGFVSDGSQNPVLSGVALGASAGTGAGSVVTFKSQSAIATTGVGAAGLIAQSIGGGGGVAQAYGVSGAGPVTLGASGGASGSGAAVNVTSNATITTSGTYAHGIVAQSIGGGGGFFQAFDGAGAPLSLAVNGGGGAGGDSGAVNVQIAADIVTTGMGAHGVVAQSIAGGGGLVGGGALASSLPANGSFAGSAGGVGVANIVTVNTQANVIVSGVDSTAILAQSAGATGLGGAIGVTLGNGALGTNQGVVGGAGAGNAVALLGGAANSLVSYATLTTQSGLSGMTITGGLGGDNVTNYGHLIGSLNLGGGANSLFNGPYRSTLNPTNFAGVYDSGATIYLGAGNLFTNSGLLSPGYLLNVFTSNETGNFAQVASGSCGSFGSPTSACGYFGMDLDLSNQTGDRLNVTGTASLGGAVVVDVMNPGMALPGAHDVTIIDANGGATMAGVQLQTFQTAVATYSLTQPNPNDIDLHYVIDFSPQGLTQNQHSVGNAVNAIQTARVSPAFTPIAAALFYQPDVATLGTVYNSLSGEGVAAAEQSAFASNDRFQSSVARQLNFWITGDEAHDPNARLSSDQFMSYAGQDDVGSPAFANLKSPATYAAPRSWRAWATGFGGSSNYPGNASVGSASVNEDGAGYAAGVDYQIDNDGLLGLAGGYTRSGFSVPDRWTSGTVEGGHVAAYGAVRGGAAYLQASFGGDFFSNNETRAAFIPGANLPSLFGTPIAAVQGFSERPSGSFDSQSWSGSFETGYRTRYGGFDVTPYLGAQFSILNMSGFTENNFGAPSVIGLAYQQHSVVTAPTFVGLQFSRSVDLGYGMSLYGWLRVAWRHELDPTRSIEAAFISAPGFNFLINGAPGVANMARIDTGVRLAVARNVSLFGVFQGDFGSGSRNVTGSGGLLVSW